MRHIPSPNFGPRESKEEVSLVVLHNISLPPFEYGTDAVEKLFANRLDPNDHPFFGLIHTLRVSSHFLIKRDGETVQFVSCDNMAYHAGVSSFGGREKCNAFSSDDEVVDPTSSQGRTARKRNIVAESPTLSVAKLIFDHQFYSNVQNVCAYMYM